MKEMHGLDVDPLTDIAICSGQTEAFAAAVFALIDPGDEVILFDPSYETYGGCITMAGGIPVCVDLDPPHWTSDPNKAYEAFYCQNKSYNIEQVYEYITFYKEKHVTLVSLPGMQKRTIITSSLSKTFVLMFCWRVGWAIASACIASTIRNIHTRITDCAPAPFQEAVVTALRIPPEYFELLRSDYESKRDFIIKMLAGVGFRIQFKPQGSVFVFAELPESCLLSDVEFIKESIKQAGVVAVPGCRFFHTMPPSDKRPPADLSYQQRYIRFAFCKSDATLAAAAQKIAGFSDARGRLKLF
uniref:Aminotransferase class I/classII large domain-containing protein n=1 Tax=Vitis vinifera TaxID=29760 RepID=F6HZ83_VITVI